MPDIRDFTLEHEKVKALKLKAPPEKLPSSVDLREWCSPIEDQNPLGSCASHAVIALVEFLEMKTKGEYLDASRLFLYKVVRRLEATRGDNGSTIRGNMKTLKIFGVPPEKYWPYDAERFDEEPPAFCYSFALSYQAITYFRLDPPDILRKVREQLARGWPIAFGFTVYSSIYKSEVGKTGDIPFPKITDRVVGGHGVAAVGYDDSRGRVLIRNSWGTTWGNEGYGILPYEYVERGLARDFWVLTSTEYERL
jgi:C1A family cysteine protease